jgi:hypothetical protein
MRILLTNNTLHYRAGSELYVRDVAIELMRRGHRPVVFSTALGPIADELRAATVPAIDRIEMLGEPPDIIHGHHHYDTLIALLRFPRTPAIYFCHGWSPWQEAPLKHPNILRYAAVSEHARERLITEGGISADRIEFVSNFFDCRVFHPRGPLPEKPLRALALGNEFSERSPGPILREACAHLGIELHFCGLANGNPSSDPGPLIANYDVVFGKGRVAIEALAVGAAVVLCDQARLGPMISTGNFDAMRRMNFGLRAFTNPLTPQLAAAELLKYDRDDAMRVSRTVRDKCELQPAVDRLIGIYERVVSEGSVQIKPDPEAATACVADYLQAWARRYKDHAGWRDLEEQMLRNQALEQLLAQKEQLIRCLSEKLSAQSQDRLEFSGTR